MKKAFLASALATGLLALSASANADVIAYWNYNTGVAGTPWPATVAATSGPGTMTHNWNVALGDGGTEAFGGYTINAQGGDPAGAAFCPIGSAGNNNAVTFAVDTTGFEDIVMNLAVRNTATGYTTYDVYTSPDGSTFTFRQQFLGPGTTAALRTADLSAFTDLDNNPNAAIRIVLSGASATNGNARLDNVTIEGTPAGPPPSGVVVDGDITDADYVSLGTYTGPDGFGPHGLVELKAFLDPTAETLNIGVVGNSERTGGSGNFNSFVVFIDSSDATGVPSGTPLPASTDGGSPLNGVAGSVLDFEVDYALRATTNPDNLETYPSIIDYTAGSPGVETFEGTFNAGTPSSFNSTNYTGMIDFATAADRTAAATAESGLEFSIALADIGSTTTSQFRIMAAYVGGGGNFWSTDTIPETGSASNLAGDPNFVAIAGRQSASYPGAPPAQPTVASVFADGDDSIVVRLSSAPTVPVVAGDFSVGANVGTAVAASAYGTHGANDYVVTFTSPFTGDTTVDTLDYDNNNDDATSGTLYAGIMDLATLRGTVGGPDNISSLDFNSHVTVRGVVIENVIDLFNLRNVYVQEGAFGVLLNGASGSNLAAAVAVNDEVLFTGGLSSNNGAETVVERTAAGVGLLGVAVGAAPTPNVLDATTATQADYENAEGTRVSISNLSYVDAGGTVPDITGSDLNVDLVGVSPLLIVRLDRDLETTFEGETYPSGTGTISGILGQFDNTAPRTEAYQIMPLSVADFSGGFTTNVADWTILDN